MIIFKSLGIEELRRIIKIQLESLRRMLEERKIALTLDSSAEEVLAREGFDPIYGARPLKRAIQNMIQNPLAMKLLGGEIKPNESVVIRGDLDQGRMVFAEGGEDLATGRRGEGETGGPSDDRNRPVAPSPRRVSRLHCNILTTVID